MGSGLQGFGHFVRLGRAGQQAFRGLVAGAVVLDRPLAGLFARAGRAFASRPSPHRRARRALLVAPRLGVCRAIAGARGTSAALPGVSVG